MRIAIALLALLFASCGKLNDTITGPVIEPEPDPSATFTRVQNEIFTPSCATLGCHNTLGPQENLILSSGQAYAQIVGVQARQMPMPRVAAGDYVNSYLYRKITGAGIVGDRMPQGQPPLTNEQIALVRNWIRRGAPND